MLIDDDIRGRRAMEDPHGFFRELREHDPVHWSDASRAWILTSHDEVSAGFRDRRLSSDRLTPLERKMSAGVRERMSETLDLLRGWMVFRDEPEHRRLRDPVRKAFGPAMIDTLVPRIETIVEELLERLAGRNECDLVSDFAFPLPATVIAELLGVPVEDRDRFRLWSRELSGLVFGAVEQPDRDAAAGRAASAFRDYFGNLVRRYEREPADNLVRALIEARDTGDSLPPELLAGACTMLLFAGHETTTSLITVGMALLFDRPDELERLRTERALDESAVEELLRYEGPAKVMVRVVGERHERRGKRFDPGERVYLSVAGANRDPAVFTDPDRLDVGRDPNPHLSFGLGSHFCLGANLARIEARIAIGRLVRRFPALRDAGERPAWVSTIIGRGLPSLPVRLA